MKNRVLIVDALEKTLEELEEAKGKQFDPEIVEMFLNERIYEFAIGR